MTAALAPAPSAPRVAADGSVQFVAAVTGAPDEVDDLIVPARRPHVAQTASPRSCAGTTGASSSAGSPSPPAEFS